VAELRSIIETIDDPVALIDIIASTLDLSTADKQEILATLDVETRAQKVSRQVTRQVELLELGQKIRAETKESMDKVQREYFLREQLKAIRKELGEEDGKNS
jgi:ATP-dependent Lon protease